MTDPDPTVGTGTPEGVTDSPSPDSTSTGQSQEALNPSWDPVLKELPEIFHDKMKGHFKSWDDNYRGLETSKRELEEKYEPYKSYLGVDPQAIQYGLTMLQRAQQNPLELYNNLRAYVEQQGLLKPEQQTPTPEGESLDEDPRFTEFERRQQDLDQRQQQIDEYIQEQAYNQEVAGYETDVDTQVQAVIAKYGDKSVNVDDLLMRMYVQAQQNNGNFDAEAAYQEQLGIFKALYAGQNGTTRPAPNVLAPGGTTASSTEVKPEDMNEEQRAAYFKNLLDFANSNAGG